MDDYKRAGHLHDGNWSGRKLRKRDKARARAMVKRETRKEIAREGRRRGY